jgi:hypothetical protein
MLHCATVLLCYRATGSERLTFPQKSGHIEVSLLFDANISRSMAYSCGPRQLLTVIQSATCGDARVVMQITLQHSTCYCGHITDIETGTCAC